MSQTCLTRKRHGLGHHPATTTTSWHEHHPALVKYTTTRLAHVLANVDHGERVAPLARLLDQLHAVVQVTARHVAPQQHVAVPPARALAAPSHQVAQDGRRRLQVGRPRPAVLLVHRQHQQREVVPRVRRALVQR